MRIATLPRLSVLAAVLFAGCGNAPEPPAAPQEEILQAGDATVRATVMQTSTLSEAIAERYGIERGDEVVMLMVGVRQGPPDAETSVPVTVSASATDLRGRRHDLPMRELRAGDLVDHIGTLRVDMPETLAFDIQIEREGQAPVRMGFSRDFR